MRPFIGMVSGLPWLGFPEDRLKRIGTIAGFQARAGHHQLEDLCPVIGDLDDDSGIIDLTRGGVVDLRYPAERPTALSFSTA